MYELDSALTRALNGLAGAVPALDFLMVWASAIGIPVLVVAVAGQWWRFDDRKHTRYVILSAGLSFLLGLALNQGVLLPIHRIRPYEAGLTHLLIAPSADPSFPSDHATAAVAIAAAFLLHRMWRSGIWFLAVSLLVMASRVFVGTHYVGDVLGGALTGLVAAVLVAIAYREGTRVDRLITSIW